MKFTHDLKAQIIATLFSWMAKDVDERIAIAQLLEAFAAALRAEVQD